MGDFRYFSEKRIPSRQEHAAHAPTHLLELSVSVYMYVCMYVCMYVWLYVCMYTSLNALRSGIDVNDGFMYVHTT